MQKTASNGFSLVELLITLTVIIVLAVIAIPSYQDYMRRAYYSEIVQAASPFKEKIAECYQKQKKLKGCNSGSHTIPAAITKPVDGVGSLDVLNGVITVTPVAAKGVRATDTCIMTPTVAADGALIWVNSGDAVKHGCTK